MNKLHLGLTPWNFSDLSAVSLCEQAQFAERCGYESIWLPENHFGANALPDPLTLLASMAGATQSIRLGTTSYLLTLRNPLQAAEQVAVLDQLSGGRLILGVGRGYAPEMLRAFHVPAKEKRRIFAWTLGLMKDAWSGKSISLDGNREHAVEVHPRPLQQPHPPLWVAAFGPKALAQAGTLGLPYLCSPMESMATLENNYEQHVQAAEAAGIAAPDVIPLMRTVFVSEDAALLKEVKTSLAEKSENVRLLDGESVDDWTLIGTPEQVRAKLQNYQERLGMTHLVATRLRIGGIDEADLRRSVTLLADIVAGKVTQRPQRTLAVCSNFFRGDNMTFNILWPAMRWPDNREIEVASVGEHTAHFCERYNEVTDEQWASCDALVSVNDIPAEYRAKLTRCRIFVTPKVGFDNLDLKAWAELGIPVCNVPDYGTQEVADHAMALMLSLMKGITFHTRELKQDPKGLWRPALNPYGKRLSVCTFGVVGLGRIGTAAALRAKAFGMDVVMYDPFRENGAELSVGIRRVQSLEELFSSCDVVSLHLPLSADTEKLINAEVLSYSKPGLVLINTARGPIIDLDGLYQAMQANHVQAAGLDVLPEEPANPDHPLIKAWAADEEWINHRLLITPHSAFFTPESVYDMRFKGGEVALTYLEQNRLNNCVNAQWLKQPR